MEIQMFDNQRKLGAGALGLIALAITSALAAPRHARPVPPPSKQQVQARLGETPLAFAPNEGQTNAGICFLTRGGG